MNKKDIEDYIIDVYENRGFVVDIPKENNMNAYLLSNKIENYNKAKKYIDNLNNSCYLSSISSRGTIKNGMEIYCYNIKQKLVGTQYKILYKGIEFQVFIVEDEVKLITLWWSEFSNGNSSYGDRLGNHKTLEEFYNKAIDIVIKSKRKAMTYYNKEIKDLKQIYKRELKRHNDILKLRKD